MNSKKTFIIRYKALDASGLLIKEGKIKAKNKYTKFEAQCGLENYLQKKYKNFNTLIVLSCYEDILGMGDLLGDMFGGFN